MAVAVAERGGLHAAATRFVCADGLSDGVRASRSAARAVEAGDAHGLPRRRVTYGEVMRTCERAYAAAGHPGAWREHYQGGPIAYRQREFEIVPTPDREPLVRHPDRGRSRARLEPERCGRRQVRGHLSRRAGRSAPSHRHGQLAARRRPAGSPRPCDGTRGMKADAALGRRGLQPLDPRRAGTHASPTAPPSGSRYRASRARACSRR